jgi:hypothetical protein
MEGGAINFRCEPHSKGDSTSDQQYVVGIVHPDTGVFTPYLRSELTRTCRENDMRDQRESRYDNWKGTKKICYKKPAPINVHLIDMVGSGSMRIQWA